MTPSKFILLLFFGLKSVFGFSQHTFTFLKPADSLQKQRLKGVVLSETILTSGALIGLNQLWYADYEHSALHAVNDNDEWLQMDKTGHFFRPTISRVLGQMLCDGVVVIKKVNCFMAQL